LTEELKLELFEKLVQKLKNKLVVSISIDGDKNRHNAHIYIVCDCFLMWMNQAKVIEDEQLFSNLPMRVTVYRQYYNGFPLHEELIKQYEVDDGLKHLLLSPRAQYHVGGYKCCDSCTMNLLATKEESNHYNSPKDDIANGLAVGYIPQTCSYSGKYYE